MVPVWITFSDLFKVMIIQRQITWKWYNIQLYLQWPTNRKSHYDLSNAARFGFFYKNALYKFTVIINSLLLNGAIFQLPWTTPTPNFKVTPFFDAEYLRNGTTYRHRIIEIQIGTYTRPMQQCHLEWPWVTLGDLAKYSMTWSVARSLCDSWASCLCRQ